MEKLNVLIACEESQRVCLAFREKGANAFSCDLQECSGNAPHFHIQGDCLELFKENNIKFFTQDGFLQEVSHWDLIIAHPPCTYFSCAGARHMYKGGKLNEERYQKMLEMRRLFFACLNAPCDHICVENPTPMKIANLPPFSQVIQPYEYGHPFTKRTLLWLKNLPTLKPTDIRKERLCFAQYFAHDSVSRSKTFTGIAKAMADQWFDYLEKERILWQD